ncbi:uncharacterized protein LOC131165642 isoform X2 [Malania oleifera]|uniref:uncharacterized protein LOC131165642 isoform X2 n=1 Tax=Malania oleifera TaxID=397392 RepID=UPI0025AEC099|nr:uncharacterized protein LOC131165642 isoform X2 [Malania oleifera]
MFKFLSHHCKGLTPSRLKTLLLLFSTLCNLYLLLRHHPPRTPPLLLHPCPQPLPLPSPPPPTALRHILFSIAASSSSLPRRAAFLRLWYSPNSTRAFLFLDRPAPDSDPSLPPTRISGDTSRFPYTFPRGLRSAIRVARVVQEAVALNEPDVRWFVFGDDDTLFFPANLEKTLSKYDHNRWYYVGANSENYEQNEKYSFDMAFGGGGFAISRSLGVVLARVLDSCLVRYSHLYGSDSRVYSCLAELGVGLTRESGFHQVDIRGNLFGMLSAHPLSPLLSLHHLDSVDPIFPNMNKTEAVEHLFKAVDVDPARILQQTVCYDLTNSLTISVAWGYAVQVFEGNQLLPDLLPLQRTFMPWKRGQKSLLEADVFFMRESTI